MLVLASSSPRRTDLLAQLLDPSLFRIEPADIDEEGIGAPHDDPARFATTVARAKADEVWQPGQVVLAADTVVLHDGRILGKPARRDDAVATIASMRGQTVEVVSAVVVTGVRGARVDEVVRTDLHMGRPDDAAIASYVATGAADDKAGGLAVQDGAGSFVEHISGCVTNVHGLPLCATSRLLRHAGVAAHGPCPGCGAATHP